MYAVDLCAPGLEYRGDDAVIPTGIGRGSSRIRNLLGNSQSLLAESRIPTTGQPHAQYPCAIRSGLRTNAFGRLRYEEKGFAGGSLSAEPLVSKVSALSKGYLMPGPVTSRHILLSGYSTGSADHVDTLQLLTPDTTDPFGWKLADSLALISPTFGAYDQVRQILYTSHSAQTFLSAIAVDRAKDTLRLLNSVQIGTVNPAHLSLSADRNFLLAASFTSGHVSVTEVKQTGELGRVIALMSTEAHGGPLKVQTGSQPHQVVSSVDGGHVFVPDRGCDRILIYRFNQSSGSLEPLSAVKTRPGSGPRHMTFHPLDPTVAYVVNELDSSVSIFRWDDNSEQLVFVRVFSSIPSTFIGPNSAAEIEVTRDGRFLFVSNRGHDSIARYALSPDHLELEFLGWTPVEGCTPRFIGLNTGEDELWVTAQDSDRVQRFNLKPDTGELSLSGSYAFPSPAFVAFV